jgi:hypothetical protein
MRLTRIACCAAVAAFLLAPNARADEWGKLTYFTFSGPVSVPGTTLPAGTYMFKIADSMSNRHIVQIFRKDGKKLFKTILAIPDQRLEPSDKPIVMFAERAAGTPQAVKAWFYPGRTIGDEFVYPRQQAIAIAKATHESVLSSPGESMRSDESLKDATVARVDENASSQPAPAPAPKVARSESPAPVPPAAPSPTGTAGTTGTGRRRELPRTASPLPLFELLSGLSFAGAFGVRLFRSR